MSRLLHTAVSRPHRTIEGMQQASGERVEQQQTKLQHSRTSDISERFRAGLRNYHMIAELLYTAHSVKWQEQVVQVVYGGDPSWRVQKTAR